MLPVPEPLKPRVEVDRTRMLTRLAIESWADGCLNEGAAAARAYEALAATGNPGVRRVLSIIAPDEARHARLGWDVLSWCLEAGGPQVRDALAAGVLERTSTPATYGAVGMDDAGPCTLDAVKRASERPRCALDAAERASGAPRCALDAVKSASDWRRCALDAVKRASERRRWVVVKAREFAFSRLRERVAEGRVRAQAIEKSALFLDPQHSMPATNPLPLAQERAIVYMDDLTPSFLMIVR